MRPVGCTPSVRRSHHGTFGCLLRAWKKTPQSPRSLESKDTQRSSCINGKNGFWIILDLRICMYPLMRDLTRGGPKQRRIQLIGGRQWFQMVGNRPTCSEHSLKKHLDLVGPTMSILASPTIEATMEATANGTRKEASRAVRSRSFINYMKDHLVTWSVILSYSRNAD